MKYPKIISAKVLQQYTLLVEFDNGDWREYDVAPLFNQSIFLPLKDLCLFKNVHVEQGGYAVSWNNEIDISEYELWQNGKPCLAVEQS